MSSSQEIQPTEHAPVAPIAEVSTPKQATDIAHEIKEIRSLIAGTSQIVSFLLLASFAQIAGTISLWNSTRNTMNELEASLQVADRRIFDRIRRVMKSDENREMLDEEGPLIRHLDGFRTVFQFVGPINAENVERRSKQLTARVDDWIKYTEHYASRATVIDLKYFEVDGKRYPISKMILRESPDERIAKEAKKAAKEDRE